VILRKKRKKGRRNATNTFCHAIVNFKGEEGFFYSARKVQAKRKESLLRAGEGKEEAFSQKTVKTSNAERRNTEKEGGVRSLEGDTLKHKRSR